MQIAFGVVLVLLGLFLGLCGASAYETHRPFQLLLLSAGIWGVIYGLIVFRPNQGLTLLSIAAAFMGLAAWIGALLWSHKPTLGLLLAGVYYIPFLIILGIRYKRGTLHWK
jgi:hypothetical protein